LLSEVHWKNAGCGLFPEDCEQRGEMSEAVIDRKGADKEPLIICWSAFSDEMGNFLPDPLMVYFQQ